MRTNAAGILPKEHVTPEPPWVLDPPWLLEPGLVTFLSEIPVEISSRDLQFGYHNYKSRQIKLFRQKILTILQPYKAEKDFRTKNGSNDIA